MRTSKLVCIVMAALGFSGIATESESQAFVAPQSQAKTSQENELPSAAELLKKHVQASGGLKELDKIETSITKGTLEIPAFGIDGDITIYQAAPNKLKMIVDLGNVGQQSSGFDGKVVWEISQQGPQILEGDRAEQIKLQGQITGFATANKFFDSMETVDQTEFNGEETFVVLCKKKGSSDKKMYFSKDSGFVIGTEGEETTPVGKVNVVSCFSNYEKIGKVRFCKQIIIKIPGMEQKVSLEEIKLNEELPEDAFKLPESIQRKLR